MMAEGAFRFQNTPRNRRPFMQLDLQNVPPQSAAQSGYYQNVIFQPQCYRLVQDLSPETPTFSTDHHQHRKQSTNGIEENITHISGQLNNQSQSAQQTPQQLLRRRRQLPVISEDKKPLEKLWKQELNRSKVAQHQPLSIKIANALQSTGSASNNNVTQQLPRSSSQSSSQHREQRANHWWTKKLSNNMIMKIETDRESGRALSLNLIHDDDDEEEEDRRRPTTTIEPILEEKTGLTNPANIFVNSILIPDDTDDENGSFFADVTGKKDSDNAGELLGGAPTSDSGVSSNMQSPAMSINSNESTEMKALNGTDSLREKLSSPSQPISSSSTSSTLTKLSTRDVEQKVEKLPDPTHRVLHKFCARHMDEIDLEVGDTVHVYIEHDDLWSDGVNIRTGERGIFPTLLITDIEYSEFVAANDYDDYDVAAATAALMITRNTSFCGENMCTKEANCRSASSIWRNLSKAYRIERKRLRVDFLASIEVRDASGERVLHEAIDRIVASKTRIASQQSICSSASIIRDDSIATNEIDTLVCCACVLEISDIGLRMRSTRPDAAARRDATKKTTIAAEVAEIPQNDMTREFDCFFALSQITYCGYRRLEMNGTDRHDDNNYHFAFITRHPIDRKRFAAHVFDVCDDIERTSFSRFYDHFAHLITLVPFEK